MLVVSFLPFFLQVNLESPVKMVSLVKEERREKEEKLENLVTMAFLDHPDHLGYRAEMEGMAMDETNSSPSTVEAV